LENAKTPGDIARHPQDQNFLAPWNQQKSFVIDSLATQTPSLSPRVLCGNAAGLCAKGSPAFHSHWASRGRQCFVPLLVRYSVHSTLMLHALVAKVGAGYISSRVGRLVAWSNRVCDA
jgi:hypothetical protein